MYKLIAIDLDGTLLNQYDQISQKNKLSIKKAKSKGIEVILASGRNPMSVKNLAQEIGSDSYAICGNGSIVYDLKKDEIIYNKFLDKKKILQIVKICEENSIHYNIYTCNSIITKNLAYSTLFYHWQNAQKPDNKKTNINIVQDIYKYIEERQDQDYLKVSICDDNIIIFGGIIKKLRRIKGIEVLDVAHMSKKIIKSGTENIEIGYYYTEISAKGVHKWDAIEFLTRKLEIRKEEVFTIGDNVNDKEMLLNAGLGVAMGNSAPYIKEYADVVVSDNNSDGVAEAIDKYVLNTNN